MRTHLISTAGLVVCAVSVVMAGSAAAQTLPAWDKKFPTETRFRVLADFNNEAVLDRETGLVWEQAPSQMQMSWVTARFQCARKGVGGRMGWRLPTFNELTSLMDPSLVFDPMNLVIMLPPGHPFTVRQTVSQYWMSNGDELPEFAWAGHFFTADVLLERKVTQGTLAWCVRAPGAADAQ